MRIRAGSVRARIFSNHGHASRVEKEIQMKTRRSFLGFLITCCIGVPILLPTSRPRREYIWIPLYGGGWSKMPKFTTQEHKKWREYFEAWFGRKKAAEKKGVEFVEPCKCWREFLEF